jgi:hypothetical protein
MPRIAIPKVRDDRPAVEYRVRLDPKLNDELVLYGRLYQETYCQPIDPKDLLEPIVRRFLATDRDFRGFRRAQASGSSSVADATLRTDAESQ